ncbi:MAG: tRNA (adenosine(37)-N6)-threonylcarbamoyltransferase complex transferase subunit TsaD [Candidatus Omnitrophica bacterium]|nr:tRNA (adenosine(37)-N6)-threonylcarbamoyltransferase complex transferase subunit TsaD [Candidatus Omnitrophota bacterium]
MLVLGIETSCDETAAAVVKNGHTVLSSCVSSSVHLHQRFGGIVPEIASRFHLEYIIPVTTAALKEAKASFSDIDLIAVTHTPGLVGSLLVGVSFAKALSLGLAAPLLGVNHIHAHLFSPFLNKKRLTFPFIGLVVSGGHTSIALVRGVESIRIIGRTRDDAAGEAFDKVAKIMELPYPGGPVIDTLARTVKDSPFHFNCAQFEDSFDFSFSGIKTDVLYTWQKLKTRTRKTKAQIACAFQQEAVNTIVRKSIAACRYYNIKTLCVGGGVTCNSLLRERLIEEGGKQGITVLPAEKRFCIDNAAMIAGLGYHLYKKGRRSDYTLSACATR